MENRTNIFYLIAGIGLVILVLANLLNKWIYSDFWASVTLIFLLIMGVINLLFGLNFLKKNKFSSVSLILLCISVALALFKIFILKYFLIYSLSGGSYLENCVFSNCIGLSNPIDTFVTNVAIVLGVLSICSSIIGLIIALYKKTF